MVKAQTTLSLRAQKHVVLLDLIAVRDNIQTFLTLLGQVVQASGVDIRRYEPLAPSSPVIDRFTGDGWICRIAAVSSADGAIAVVGGKKWAVPKTTTFSRQDQDESVTLEPLSKDLSLRLTIYDCKPKAVSP